MEIAKKPAGTLVGIQDVPLGGPVQTGEISRFNGMKGSILVFPGRISAWKIELREIPNMGRAIWLVQVRSNATATSAPTAPREILEHLICKKIHHGQSKELQ